MTIRRYLCCLLLLLPWLAQAGDGADFAAATSSLVTQAQPMVFDLEKPTVNRQLMRGFAGRRREFALRVFEKFILMI